MTAGPMLTIEEHSVVMKVAVPERASTTHLFARSARSTGVGVRLERGGLAAERGRDDEGDRGRARWTRLCAKHPHIGIRQPAWLLLFAHRGLCRRMMVPSADGAVKHRGLRFTHEKPSRPFRKEPLRSSPILPPEAGE